ncbi:MAG: TRAM domain-containing protein [Syntrophales bacterium]|nr:TRAM domain-containing protein [Syntrophales bacterium]
MFQFIIRFLLILACSISGYFIAFKYYGFPVSLIGLLLGFIVAIFVIQIEQGIRKVSLRIIFGGVIGTIIGLLIAFLFAYGLSFVSIWEKQEIVPWIYVILTCTLGYLGLVIGSKKSEEFSFTFFGSGKTVRSGDYRILDTSVVIDGRIADICETGFLDGNLIVPRFVLDELQHIADSSDSMKRSRGRRGLDVLNRMQKTTGLTIEVVDHDFPKIKGVDGKLVALAKKIGGKIITNDFNLNKVAEIQGIKILNVNELANALKPVVLPGEGMIVKIIKEGKETGQGVAYLDDGTMVIVDNAVKHIGDTVDVVVTSVLQTTAGRMIFSEIKEPSSDRNPVGAASGN